MMIVRVLNIVRVAFFTLMIVYGIILWAMIEGNIIKVKKDNKSFVLIIGILAFMIVIILFPEVTAPKNNECFKVIVENKCEDNPYYFIWEFNFGFLADEFDYICCPKDYCKGLNKTICEKKDPQSVKLDDCDWHKFTKDDLVEIKECKDRLEEVNKG